MPWHEERIRQAASLRATQQLVDATVLGIESSCDDTGVAIARRTRTGAGQGAEVVAEFLSSQFAVHQSYGGVVPRLAARAHALNMPVAVESVRSASQGFAGVDAVAVAAGPGLAVCLRVGYEAAIALARELHRPLVKVNHLEAHLLAVRMNRATWVDFPFLVVLASGGHTLVALARGVGKYTVLGTTLDDSLGETFDKVARAVRVGRHCASPRPTTTTVAAGAHATLQDIVRDSHGTALSAPRDADETFHGHLGAALEHLAREGDPFAVDLPVPLRSGHAASAWASAVASASGSSSPAGRRDALENAWRASLSPLLADLTGSRRVSETGCAFSFAGLKSAVIRYCESRPAPGVLDRQIAANVAASFQRVACRHLQEQLLRAIAASARELQADSLTSIVLCGGVAANQTVRSAVQVVAQAAGVPLVVPPPSLCTDNGAMVAWAGVEKLAAGVLDDARWDGDFSPRWPLGQVQPLYVPRKAPGASIVVQHEA